MCAVELEDNQMSTQRLYYWDDVDPGDEFEFLPYREYFIRKNIQNDPIIKYRQVINKSDFQYGVAIRKSGRVDVYYNYALKSETQDAYMDVEITFINIFGLKRDPKTKSAHVYKINSQDTNARVSFESATDAGTLKPRRWELLCLDTIKHHVRVFNSMILGRRSFLVSHSHFVSIYDLIKNDWVKHMEFESKVKVLLRDYEEMGSRKVFVVLDNGKIFMIEQDNSTIFKEWQLVKDVMFPYQGIVKQICSDFVDLCFHCVRTHEVEGNKNRLYYIANSAVKQLNIELKSNTSLLILNR